MRHACYVCAMGGGKQPLFRGLPHVCSTPVPLLVASFVDLCSCWIIPQKRQCQVWCGRGFWYLDLHALWLAIRQQVLQKRCMCGSFGPLFYAHLGKVVVDDVFKCLHRVCLCVNVPVSCCLSHLLLLKLWSSQIQTVCYIIMLKTCVF